MPCSKPLQTIHHANRAVSQVKMNWLWVRATRGRAYGSDEAENWPQRKTERERKKEREATKKERGKKKGRAREKKGKREGGELRDKQHPEIQASINGACMKRACIFAVNNEWCINTGLVLGCPSRSVVCVWFIMGYGYIYQWVDGLSLCSTLPSCSHHFNQDLDLLHLPTVLEILWDC